ncbi:MAG TPA: hypothetical protein VGE41_00065 [Verrucomicrobiae bacterium]
MKIEALHIGMKVRHPQYGLGTVKSLNEHTAEIRFEEGQRTVAPETSGITPAEPQAEITGMSQPLSVLVRETAEAIVAALGLEKSDTIVEGLGARWHRGKVMLHPSDPTLQAKEIPLDVFFHKIVMVRNNLRVLEQKINGHDKLNDAEKVEFQQYITRSYGSLTTFNLLFKTKEDQFSGSSKEA